ncbi:cellular nucleic acid-binding protein [Ceratobasidium sp. AG-Ba]|nr:cellular nucleic acid-binding protein [Ceratobasidium sp. AG-Ba]
MEAKPKSCYKCGETGHLSRECSQNQGGGSGGGFGGGQSSTECYKCGKVGHIARSCPEATSSGGGYSGGGGFGGSSKTCYTCGGVGHLSRDCVQGSKCYNCNGTIQFRDTSRKTARNLNDVLATPAALKAISLVIALARPSRVPVAGGETCLVSDLVLSQ